MRLPLVVLALSAGFSATAQWTSLPDFAGTARDDAASFAIGTDIYVGTGMQVGWSLTTDWYRFNTLDESWQTIAALPASARQYCTAFAIGNVGYLFGSVDADGWLNELWAYDASANTWSQKTSLPGPGRSGSTGFALDGYGYIATGRYGADEEVSAELWRYDPATDTWAQRADLPGTARLLAASFTIDGQGYVVGGQNWAALRWPMAGAMILPRMPGAPSRRSRIRASMPNASPRPVPASSPAAGVPPP